MNDIAMLIRQYLNFDMAGVLQKFFQINASVPEAGNRFLPRGCKRRFQLLRGPRNADAAAAAPRLLHHNRIADEDAISAAFFSSATTPSEPGTRARRRFHGRLGLRLIARSSMDSGFGPMNLTPQALHSRANRAFSERNPNPGESRPHRSVRRPRGSRAIQITVFGGRGPMQTHSSAICAWSAALSAVEQTATVRSPFHGTLE
jgi:hypothetical protein